MKAPHFVPQKVRLGHQKSSITFFSSNQLNKIISGIGLFPHIFYSAPKTDQCGSQPTSQKTALNRWKWAAFAPSRDGKCISYVKGFPGSLRQRRARLLLIKSDVGTLRMTTKWKNVVKWRTSEHVRFCGALICLFWFWWNTATMQLLLYLWVFWFYFQQVRVFRKVWNFFKRFWRKLLINKVLLNIEIRPSFLF